MSTNPTPAADSPAGDAPLPELVVDGERYVIHRLTDDDHAELQAWLDGQVPDPFDAAVGFLGRGLTMAQEKHVLASALEIATRPRVRIGTPEADALLCSAAGVCKSLELAIRRGRPGFTEADARAIYGRLAVKEMARARLPWA